MNQGMGIMLCWHVEESMIGLRGAQRDETRASHFSNSSQSSSAIGTVVSSDLLQK